MAEGHGHPLVIYNYNMCVRPCVRASNATVPRFNGPAEPARTVGFRKREPTWTVGFQKWEPVRTENGRPDTAGRGRGAGGQGARQGRAGGRGPGRVGQGVRENGVRENGRPDRARQGRVGQVRAEGRGQGTAGRAGAPTGDFTVAFGHGHPLVFLIQTISFCTIVQLVNSLVPKWGCNSLA